MITTRMTAESEAAAQRYELLIEAWRAIYQAAIASPDFGSARQLADVRAEAYDLARTFISTEAAMIDAHSVEIASEAHQTTLRELGAESASELTEAAGEHLIAAVSYLTHELSVQIERDVAHLVESLRKAVLQVTIAARSRRITMKAALLQYRIGNAADIQFFFHDRGNAKWPSRKFVRAVWRHHLLSLYNEIVLLTLADHGLDQAEVSHVDPNAQSHGMRIAMSSDSELPTYAEVRSGIFHPNADAILTRGAD
ncbi:hypothetical protein SAMN05216548_1149 [Faunimonas pinastri]|uniref:Uncharacterized protein n=1 Tax=Faunimonas pinastri TaxID=1855383 RepID=A0A1H9MRF8_9HYPH|nr:hypothetical protein [Faunimonas pinastri]SER25995.1 hypothetical protein SAMN05216548_1149 [Faunimonas pinastri]